MKKQHLYTAVILLSILALGTKPVHAAIQVPSQTYIGTTQIATYSGGTYTLIEDVTETLFIEQSELILDGDGHTVTGPGSTGFGVEILGQNGITVKNLNITGFSIGIYIDNSNLLPAEPKVNTFENNNISGATDVAIRIYLTNATIITGNNISNSYWGIQVDNSGNGDISYDYSNYVTGNILTDNAGGIWLRSSSYNSLGGNTVTDQDAAGIYLSVTSHNNTLTGNNSSSNRDGINLNSSNDNIVTGNTTSSNEYGIKLTNSSNNTLTGNNTHGNTNTGIWLDPSNNNTITNNNIEDNARGIYILNSLDNEIYNNNFITNTPQAEVSGGSGNVFNLATPINGNYWSDYSGSGPYVFTGGQDEAPWDDPDGWVEDTTPPEITCPGDTSIEAMEPDGVPIDDDRIQAFLAGVSATDNVDPQEAITITNDAPAIFPPGDTVVTFTATDTSDNSSFCQSTVTIVEAAESSLRIIPRIINRDGRLTKILAVIRFPAGTTAEDIDIGQPLILYPGDSPIGIEATTQRIVTWCIWGNTRVSVFASFSKDEVTAGVPDDGPVELMVIGRFESGQYFYGFDNVWICSWNW
ncbi:MAG: HYR domain-containing protein [Planctomycetes bacterium]|nr:HYR domain-containing protein [Planctomycetota bacterium]